MPTKEYYLGQRANRKTLLSFEAKAWFIGSCLFGVIAIAAMLWAAKCQINISRLKQELNTASVYASNTESELSVLRALNPYQYKYSQILESSDALQDLMPGWVVRIYKTPQQLTDLSAMMDMGAFVLDESKFTLASHENYGLDSLGNPLYRLNGLIPATMSGRFQIGVKLSFKNRTSKDKALPNLQSACFARVDVNNKRVIEHKIRYFPGNEDDAVLTGNVMVSKGVHPISALLYCDDGSQYSGDDVQISLTFREPGSNTFKNSSESVFHLYNHTS